MREELGLKQLGTKMVKHRENILSDCDDGYCRIYESKIVSEEELIPYLNFYLRSPSFQIFACFFIVFFGMLDY